MPRFITFFRGWLLLALVASFCGCGGGGSDSVAPTTGGSSGAGNNHPGEVRPASALLFFELTDPTIVLGRIAEQATTYRLTVVTANGQIAKTVDSPRVERWLVEGLPVGPVLLRTEFLDASGQVIGFLDRFTRLQAGQTAVLELSGFVTGPPPAGTPSFPGSGGSPAQLVFTLVPHSVAPGTPFSVAATVLDAEGVILSSSAGTVTLQAFGATLQGSTSGSLRDGIATLSNLSASGSPGTFTLSASVTVASQTLQAKSLPIQLGSSPSSPNVGVPASLRFVSSPTAGVAGADLAPVIVEVVDVYGQRVISASHPITLSLSQNPLPPEGAVLSGALTVSANNGLASFSNARLSRSGAYRLNASASDLIGVSSAVLTIAAAPVDPSTPGQGLFDGVMVFVRTAMEHDQSDQPRDVLSGDFDGDGILDLAMVKKVWSGGQIIWARGRSDGTFETPSGLTTALRMETAAVSDLDGDGDLDLVATSFEGGGVVRPYLNDGNGVFTEQAALVAGAGCFEVTLADVDGNGSPDIVTVNRDAGTVAIFANAGGGVFAPRASYPVHPMPVGVAAGDLDGDGDLDLAIAHVTSGTVSLLENSDGVFSVHTTIPMGAGAFSVVLIDLDGDARPDLVTANRDAGTISIRPATGNFTFASVETHATGELPHAVKAGDFNNDGQPDLATVNFGGDSATVFTQASGAWTAQMLSLGSGPLDLTLGDFDGDGYLDLASGNYNECSALVRINDTAGGFRGPLDLGGSSAGRVLSGDLDADGNDDLLVLGLYSETFVSRLEVRFGDGQGAFTPGVLLDLNRSLSSPQLYDVDGDGDLDLVALSYHANTQSVVVYLNDGAGRFSGAQVLDSPTAEFFALGDLNNDGWADVVTSSALDDGFSVHLGVGDGGFEATPVHTISANSTGGVALGDFNQDGILDLVARSSDVAVYLGLGDGRFGSGSVLAASGAFDFRVADVNGDGIDDIIGHNYRSIVTYLNQGSATFAMTSLSAPSRVVQLHLLDLDGDGALDVVTVNSETFPNVASYLVTSFTVFANGGSGHFAVGPTYRLGGGGESREATSLQGGDFDGDGDVDLVGIGLNNSLSLWLNR